MRKSVLVLGLAGFTWLYIYPQPVLELETCRQLALDHNKSVQIAQESVNAARELKRAAFTQFLPNFSANGAYTWNQKNISLLSEDKYLPVYNLNANGTPNYAGSWNNSWAQVAPNVYAPLDANGTPFDPKTNPEKIQWKNEALLPKSALEFDIHNIFVGSVGFVQPIFMGGKIKELYNIARYGENLANAQKENKITDLLLEVDEAYWRVVSVENKLKLATEYRNLLAQLDSNVTVMIEEGVATKAESLKVKVKLNEADVTVTKAENGLSLSKMALNQLCGMPLDSDYVLADEDLNQSVDITLIPTDQAINNRPEIKALVQAQNISKANERIMIARFLPNIGVTGNYVVSNPNSFNGYANEFGGGFSVGVVANVPLCHFGDKFHTLNAAKSQSKIATLQLEEAKEKIQLQIQQNSYKVAESVKKEMSTRKNIEQAEENLRYATEGFDAGVITSTDLLGAQTAWLSAKSENIDASIDVKLCNLYLTKSLGTLHAEATIK